MAIITDDVVLGIIPARGGSRRVPRKNIKPLGNRPLVSWVIDAAKKSKALDYFLVSTNDDEIAEISRSYGAPVPFKRPEALSEDVDSALVLKHALNWYEQKTGKTVSHVCCLQCTTPFTYSDDIDTCVRIAKSDPTIDTVFTVAKAKQHPYWMFVSTPFTHEVEPFCPEIRLEGENLVSQNLPLVWYPNGAVYVTRCDVILNDRIFGKKLIAQYMPEIRSIDLEEPYDFIVASAILKSGMLKENMVSEWVIT